MIARFLNSQSKNISSAVGVLMVSTIISGILGVLRDRFLAATFGARIETSIYFAAFRIPDLVYNILILGGILVSFLPLFAEYFSENEEKAWQMVNYVLNVFLFFLLIICLVLFFLTPWLTKLITPGFSPEDKAMVVRLTRLLFLSPILFGISNIFSGLLHYFNRFLSYGLAPILYNLGIIFGILVLSQRFGIMGVGMGVILGAFLHLIIQIPPALSCGFRYRFFFDLRHPAIKIIFSLMLPRIFGIIASQLNLIIITAIASTITAGSIAIFNFSNNLQGLPVSVLGISLATAVFPTFSKLWANGEKEEFSKKFVSLFRQIIFLIIPISILMFFLRAQIVRLFLGTGLFGWQETRLTAASLGLFTFSIFASTLMPFMARAFFSFKNTKTPALITMMSVAINTSLSFLLVWLLSFPNYFRDAFADFLKIADVQNIAMIGLPLAFSIAAIFQFLAMLFFIYKKIGDFGIKEILSCCQKILIAGVFMSFFVYLARQLMAYFVNMQTFFGVFWQSAIACLIGFSVYFLIAFLLNLSEVQLIKNLVLKVGQFKH